MTRRFELLLLACAWRGSASLEAIKQPLRDGRGLSRDPVVVDGVTIDFGRECVASGYLGVNRLLTTDAQSLDDPPQRGTEPRGVFYVASQSADYLHEPASRAGLVSMLFARRPIVAEAYVLTGMLTALERGTLGEDFVREAARNYARYQRVGQRAALRVFYR